MAKGTPGQEDTFTSPAEYRGAYTDLRDLIRLRYAAREITELTDNRTANPLAGLLIKVSGSRDRLLGSQGLSTR